MAELTNPQRVANFAAYPGGYPVSTLIGTRTRVNATAGSTTTEATAVPTGGNVLILRATAAIWIRFGGASVGAAAAGADSILFVAGEAPYVLNAGETHFRVLRAGSADVPVQIESVGTL